MRNQELQPRTDHEAIAAGGASDRQWADGATGLPGSRVIPSHSRWYKVLGHVTPTPISTMTDRGCLLHGFGKP
jgi:hypothetical protein